MKSRRLNFVAFIGLVGLVAALVTSAPAAQAPFYEGKTLRVLIASGPGDGWRAHNAEKIEGVIREHIAIPKEAKDYITKMRQKYNLPVGEAKS